MRTLVVNPPSKFGWLAFTMQSIIKIREIAKSVDIIHCHQKDFNAFAAYLIKKLYGIPYVITVYGFTQKKRTKRKLIYNLIYNNASGVIAVSEAAEAYCQDQGFQNIRHIPPIPNYKKCDKAKGILRDQHGISKDSTVLLFLARLRPAKRCEVLIKAFADLGNNFIRENNLILIIVGDGEEREKLKNLIKYSDASAYIKLIGKIPNDKFQGSVSEMFGLADLYVLPSLREGLPISLMEAMYSNLAVIGSDVRGINSLIENGQNGLLFPVDNVPKLTERIRELVIDTERREILAKNAGAFINNYYPHSKVIDEHLHFYQDVLGNKGLRHKI